MSRTLTCYDKQDESLILEIHLESFKLERVRPLFDVGADLRMYNCYELTGDKITALRGILPECSSLEWDTDKFCYFLEAHSEPKS